MSASSFTCRQCDLFQHLEKEEIAGRLSSPWKRTCACGAQYQITKTEIRLIAWAPGYVPTMRAQIECAQRRAEELQRITARKRPVLLPILPLPLPILPLGVLPKR